MDTTDGDGDRAMVPVLASAEQMEPGATGGP